MPHLQKKLQKTRVRLMASVSSEDREYLRKRLEKLERTANSPASMPGRNIPKEALRIRHKWHK